MGGTKKKGGSVATCRGMNAKQGDYKCGDRINTLLNTHGCYDGLWRKKRVNLRIARGPFGAIISMKIVAIMMACISEFGAHMLSSASR